MLLQGSILLPSSLLIPRFSVLFLKVNRSATIRNAKNRPINNMIVDEIEAPTINDASSGPAPAAEQLSNLNVINDEMVEHLVQRMIATKQ